MDFYFDEEHDIDDFLESVATCMMFVDPYDILYYGTLGNSNEINYNDFLEFINTYIHHSKTRIDILLDDIS